MSLPARLQPLALLCAVAVLAYFFANVEIQIEGPHGWAASLPVTFRVEHHWLLDVFWGGRPLTGYHAWVFAFMALVFHLPLVFGNRWTWNAEAGYPLGAGLRVSAAAGTAFHAPDGTDRFGWGGNPDLEPEFAREYALGLAWQGAAQSARIDAYENRIDDLVEYVLIDPTNFIYQTQNVGRACLRGLELGYRLDLGAWHAAASATWTDPRNLSTATTLPRRARRTGTLEVRYQGSAIELLAALRASGPRSDVDDFGLPARTAGYALLALGARWRVTPAWSVQVKVDNALDRDYALAYGYRTAGRSFSVATRYQLR